MDDPAEKTKLEGILTNNVGEPINYLQNSNNMHEVFKSLPNQNDEVRSNVNRMVRHRGDRSGSPQSKKSPETRIGG